MKLFRLQQPFYAVIDTKNVTIRVRGGGVGEVIEVKLGAGNLTYDEKVNREYIKDRGLLDTVRDGDEEPMDVRLDAQWETLTAESGGPAPTVEDVFKRRGLAADWTSTSVDPCEPFCVDIECINNQPCSEEDPEKIILPDFRYETAAHDMRGGTISFSGKCNATQAIVTRTTSTN
jgi:hypothetical protein